MEEQDLGIVIGDSVISLAHWSPKHNPNVRGRKQNKIENVITRVYGPVAS